MENRNDFVLKLEETYVSLASFVGHFVITFKYRI